MTPPHALYRFFDASEQLLYIGISANPGRRFAQHRSDKPWWVDVVTIAVQPMPTREAALAAEKDAIKTERPLHNGTHNELPDTALQSVLDHLSSRLVLSQRRELGLMPAADRAKEDFLEEFGIELDHTAALVLAAIDERGDEVCAYYSGLTSLIDSFPADMVAQARAQARATLRTQGTSETLAKVLEQTADVLAGVNRASANFHPEPAPF